MRPQYAAIEWEEESPSLGGWAGDASGKFRARKRGASRSAPSHGGGGSGGPKLTPLRYIRAQCRLVVHPDFPYGSYANGSIPFSAILRVVMPPVDCPICTCPSTVPRMLECGHVMCLPCYLRFLRHTMDKFCPICGELAAEGVVLPVSFLAAPKEFLPQQGHRVVMRLMHKVPGLPAVPLGCNPAEKPRSDQLLYSRVVCASSSYLRAELKQERDTLEREQAEALVEYGGDECYPEALDAVRHALQTKLEPRTWPKPAAPSVPAAPEAWFYQTAFESSAVYLLSNLDLTILKALYGDYSAFPSTLEVEVGHILHTTFEETDLRKRFKFLEHVPDHSQLALIEVDWHDLPQDVYQKHKKALQARKRSAASKKMHEDSQKAAAELYADTLFRAQAAEPALALSAPPPIDTASLPSLGSRTGPRPASAPAPAKKWNPALADQRDAEAILAAARARGKKQKGKWLVIQ